LYRDKVSTYFLLYFVWIEQRFQTVWNQYEMVQNIGINYFETNFGYF
jgi:hypothetical protein